MFSASGACKYQRARQSRSTAVSHCRSVELIGIGYFSPMYCTVTVRASRDTNGSFVPGRSVVWPYGIWIATAPVTVTNWGFGGGVTVGMAVGGGAWTAVAAGLAVADDAGIAVGVGEAALDRPVDGKEAPPGTILMTG